ncbi:DNA damage-inducible protein DnaD [Sporosarcina sp. NCCP-2222]|uniref:Lin1244/Lin1753 domain-containing protein n=1 Tax=Sporosarcina sp. NCCP-2222 TaxID=2935073 RepID=UPI00208C2499|nr:Lin1244/Lin1753 domain-containing protein [Sporosarcina sp. NCCP-2222]GKV54266.1 DNA damage-inducible protein DnaD [Sporosarcina sp. NCCP-2222]
MARPQKLGLDYFPLDVDIDQDDKIQLVEALHGTTGFAVVIKLLMRIYKEGYYYDWTEMEQLLFARRVNVDINLLNDIVNDCIKYGLFDEKLFEKYKILTSNGIQERYFEASKRRKNITLVNQYMLINDSKIVNANINRVNVDINGEVVDGNDAESTQNKVKESKEEESKQQHAAETDVAETPLPETPRKINRSSVVVDLGFGEIIRFYEKNVGPIIPHFAEEFQHMVDENNSELVLLALKKSVEARPKKLINYLNGILRNWKSRNLKTARDVEAHEAANEREAAGYGANRTSIAEDDGIQSKINAANERRQKLAGIGSNRNTNCSF